MHSSRCLVCKSEHCNEIEERYVEWESPYDLELEYPGISAWSIKNHCKTAGLDKKRNDNLVAFYKYFMNRGARGLIPIDGHMALKASELMARLEGRFPKESNTTLNLAMNVTITPQEDDERIKMAHAKFARVRPADLVPEDN